MVYIHYFNGDLYALLQVELFHGDEMLEQLEAMLLGWA